MTCSLAMIPGFGFCLPLCCGCSRTGGTVLRLRADALRPASSCEGHLVISSVLLSATLPSTISFCIIDFTQFLHQDARALDSFAQVSRLGTDKTGTLTKGSFELTDVVVMPGQLDKKSGIQVVLRRYWHGTTQHSCIDFQFNTIEALKQSPTFSCSF